MRKGVSLPSIVIFAAVAAVGGLIASTMLGNTSIDFYNQFNSTKSDADNYIDEGWEIDPGEGGGGEEVEDGDEGGEGVSDGFDESEMEETMLIATKNVEEYDDLDGYKEILRFNEPDMGDELSYDLRRDVLTARFISKYNTDDVDLVENLGGAYRNITVENLQTNKYLNSSAQNSGTATLPPIEHGDLDGDNMIEASGDGDEPGDVTANSIKFELADGIEKSWSWDEEKLTFDEEPGDDGFEKLYPGNNDFKVSLIQNGTGGIIEENTVTINKPYKY
jgi:hypothetical protein